MNELLDKLDDQKVTLGKKTAEVLDALIADLRNDVYRTDCPLPTEKDLCEKYGVGRNTVRRAVQSLTDAGVLTKIRGSGTYVKPPVSDVSQDALRDMIGIMISPAEEHFWKVQEHALKRGQLLSVYTQGKHEWSLENERRFIEQVARERHRGLLACLTATEPHNSGLLRGLERCGVKVVYLEHHHNEKLEGNHIIADYRRAGYLAVSAALRAGYDQVCLYRSVNSWPASVRFRQGVKEAIEDHFGGYDENRHCFKIPISYRHQPGWVEKIQEHFQASGRTAYVCHTVDLAESASLHAQAAGLRVPQDIGFIAPQYFVEMGRAETVDTVEIDLAAAVNDGIDFILDPQRSTVEELVRPKLIHRGSLYAS